MMNTTQTSKDRGWLRAAERFWNDDAAVQCRQAAARASRIALSWAGLVLGLHLLVALQEWHGGNGPDRGVVAEGIFVPSLWLLLACAIRRMSRTAAALAPVLFVPEVIFAVIAMVRNHLLVDLGHSPVFALACLCLWARMAFRAAGDLIAAAFATFEYRRLLAGYASGNVNLSVIPGGRQDSTAALQDAATVGEEK
jgi:hypothetical protein